MVSAASVKTSARHHEYLENHACSGQNDELTCDWHDHHFARDDVGDSNDGTDREEYGKN